MIKKMQSLDIFEMKNFFEKINNKECVCILCGNTFEKKNTLKYSHLIQEHSEHETVRKGLNYFKKMS